jgi:hypothetical protein
MSNLDLPMANNSSSGGMGGLILVAIVAGIFAIIAALIPSLIDNCIIQLAPKCQPKLEITVKILRDTALRSEPKFHLGAEVEDINKDQIFSVIAQTQGKGIYEGTFWYEVVWQNGQTAWINSLYAQLNPTNALVPTITPSP